MTDQGSEPSEGGTEEQSSAEKRIAQLTRQRHDAERRATAAEDQMGLLASQVAELTNVVSNLASRPATPSPAPQQRPARDPYSQALGAPGVKDQEPSPAGQPANIELLVEKAVQKGLQPITAAQEAAREASELQARQQSSFDEAAQFYPDIKVQGSKAQKAFDDIWGANPELTQLPNAPGLIINAVKGILGSETKQQAQIQEARKQVASAPVPTNPLARMTDIPTNAKTTEEAKKALAQEGAERGLNKDSLAAMIGLELGRAKIKE